MLSAQPDPHTTWSASAGQRQTWGGGTADTVCLITCVTIVTCVTMQAHSPSCEYLQRVTVHEAKQRSNKALCSAQDLATGPTCATKNECRQHINNWYYRGTFQIEN